ncbi:MAG: peptide chain release factor 3, partial [Gammaproteobacteria bacterium]|nr:peptide chain release factor 3 [Gammaproteobacteria bacterium]
ILQFDVVAYRLKAEYEVDCRFEAAPVVTARWVVFGKNADETEFRRRNEQHLAMDGHGCLVYMAPNRANLQLVIQRWPDVTFRSTLEL